jgi:hypothetical protein
MQAQVRAAEQVAREAECERRDLIARHRGHNTRPRFIRRSPCSGRPRSRRSSRSSSAARGDPDDPEPARGPAHRLDVALAGGAR